MTTTIYIPIGPILIIIGVICCCFFNRKARRERYQAEAAAAHARAAAGGMPPRRGSGQFHASAYGRGEHEGKYARSQSNMESQPPGPGQRYQSPAAYSGGGGSYAAQPAAAPPKGASAPMV